MKLTINIFILIFSSTVYAGHTCPDMMLKHDYYSTCFNASKKLARWVSYKLSEQMFRGNVRRSNSFKIDPLIPKLSPKPSHYKGSGYDRGHLVPAADMRINKRAMEQSFYMTNITAQEPSFNRGVWKKLENLIRNLTEANKQYEVLTGPIFEFKKRSHKARYLNVPKAFFKIIYYKDQYEVKTLAFLVPNKKSKQELKEFLVPVDTIEALTEINFFQDLDDHIEEDLESKIKPELWGL